MTQEEINGKKVYDYIKDRYEDEKGKRGYFWQDYFKTPEDGFPNFLENLQQYEKWLDLTCEPHEDDLQHVWDNIMDAQFSSNIITHQIDRITDKYIGDCSYQTPQP